MTLNINSFLSKVNEKRGLLSPSKFKVELPSIESVNISRESLNLMCINANMPGRQLMSQDRRIGLKVEKVVDAYAVDDVTFEFYMPADGSIKKYFETWGELAVPSRGGTIRYKSEYEKDVNIWQLNKEGELVHGCRLIEAFPTTLQAMELSSETQNILSRYSVQLSYTDWVALSPTN